ncbi:MAG: alpha-L-arabinofuranosidase [Verrucomicrobiales bacterium]|nr:alpha-L-arabinofuranosidase [Verrucomicrobiales bacterium]
MRLRTWQRMMIGGVCLGLGTLLAAVQIEIRVDQPGAPIAPTMWGVFFEDINYGADGGLYPERIKNRSFDFPEPLMGWSVVRLEGSEGDVATTAEEPAQTVRPRYVRVRSTSPRGGLGVQNEGFFGIAVQAGAEFDFSVRARSRDVRPPVLRVELVAPDGTLLDSRVLRGVPAEWGELSCRLIPKARELKARLNLVVEGEGSVDLDEVSLFPRDTWAGRRGGLRRDLVQWLADLKPGFLRFPGGCIVEGRHLETRYQWKNTVGPIGGRPLLVNRWNTEFKHRPAPDYYQSFGLGFMEYFQLCEDIGAAPLPILNCGMACQFNSGEVVPMSQLQPYLQDALDLIEFANGGADTEWGRRRIEWGHPRPFGLKYLGIGNEQWQQDYLERYAEFARVLGARHPEIVLISSAGPGPDGPHFRFAWPRLRELKAAIVDEHCYDGPRWFFDAAGRYDQYDRQGPRVFMGEYAAQSVRTGSPENRNNWECALSEAAFMTGLERNAEVVVMSSYAPLFGHEEGWQWRPNLIWCDGLRSYATPNYYVQQLFSRNRGDHLLSVQVTGQAPATSREPGLYVTACRETRTGEVILKVVNSAPEPRRAHVRTVGQGAVASRGTVTVLTAAELSEENSLEAPRRVAPITSRLEGISDFWAHTFPKQSMTVLRWRAGR